MPTHLLMTAAEPISTLLTSTGYLDPGTGSYALQLLLAGLFGGLFALKQSWQQFRAWFAQVGPRRLSSSASGDATD